MSWVFGCSQANISSEMPASSSAMGRIKSSSPSQSTRSHIKVVFDGQRAQHWSFFQFHKYKYRGGFSNTDMKWTGTRRQSPAATKDFATHLAVRQIYLGSFPEGSATKQCLIKGNEWITLVPITIGIDNNLTTSDTSISTIYQ
jgi:hypothetical protein